MNFDFQISKVDCNFILGSSVMSFISEIMLKSALNIRIAQMLHVAYIESSCHALKLVEYTVFL